MATKNWFDATQKNTVNDTDKILVYDGDSSKTVEVSAVRDSANITNELEGINTELGNINGELERVNTELGNVNGELERVNTELGNVNTELGNVNTELGNVNTELGNVNTELAGVNAGLGDVSARLEIIENNRVISETGTLYAGAIRNSGYGWEYIEDATHNNINFKTIETTENNEIKVTYTNSEKVGSMIVATDSFLASKGVTCGASVDGSQALIKCYAPFNGSINGKGTLTVNNNEWFQNTYSATKLSDDTGFEITYDGADNIEETVNANIVGSGDTTTTTHYGIDVFVSREAVNKVTLRAYSDLYAYVRYTEAGSWNVSTSCKANVTANWEAGNLIISHDSVPSYGGYYLLQSVNVNMSMPMTGTPIHTYISSVSNSSISITFYNINGDRISEPNINMRVFINRPGFKVPHTWNTDMMCKFNLGRTIIRPNQFVSTSGNLWLIGLHRLS